MAMIDPKDASYIEGLETEIAKLRAEINNKDVEIKRLKKEKGISSASDGFTFNEKTGTHIEAATGKHHCTVCLLKHEKRVPLRVEPHGYRCLICPKYYPDPDRPERTEYGDGGPDSWLAR